jgi:hypothetical protein
MRKSPQWSGKAGSAGNSMVGHPPGRKHGARNNGAQRDSHNQPGAGGIVFTRDLLQTTGRLMCGRRSA